MQNLISLYASHFGYPPARIEQLAKAGSNRQYVRFYSACKEEKTVIGVVGKSRTENHAFIAFTRHFASKGLNVPHVIAVSDDEMCYLQTDLGTCSLYDVLRSGRESGGIYNEEQRGLIAKTLRALAHIQIEGAEGLDFAQGIPPTDFHFRAVMADLHYFKYCFLKTAEVEYDEMLFEEEAERLAEELSVKDDEQNFLYRDFQARNVMLPETGEPYFIDYQSGRRGALQYDVASFLWQASAHYSDELREAMVAEYLDELSALLPSLDKRTFRARLDLFALFRTLQVLGAYGYRGFVERKQYFINSIPPALENLRGLLGKGVARAYPHIEETLKKVCEVPPSSFAHSEDVSSSDCSERSIPLSCHLGRSGTQSKDFSLQLSASQIPSLSVRVFSFSYKKGIPEDESGNGGGYVFDCRSTHNPGRYEPYKKLTGRDKAVIDFLENDGEILTFLESVYKLADAHVERYLERGFTDLMFCFGCTGGQHRSVYSAEHLAHHLHGKYGIRVVLCHREQGILEILENK